MAGVSTAMQHLAGALRSGRKFTKVNKLGKMHGTTASGKELLKRRLSLKKDKIMANWGSIASKLGKAGSKVKQGAKWVRQNKGEAAMLGAVGTATATQAGLGGKGIHDSYKQRRKEGESKTGAVLRTADPFHSYGTGRRIARYDKRNPKSHKGLIGLAKSYHASGGLIGALGYSNEMRKKGFQKVRRVKKSK